MIDVVLKIVKEFLKEQYPDIKIKCGINNRTYPNAKVAIEYTFKIKNTYTWVIITDNTSGANELFRDEIYYRSNNIKNSEILTNQLELLGLNKIY